jgi:hypothetical protein
MLRIWTLLCLSLLTNVATAQQRPTSTAYVNGYWFDGAQFARRTGYVIGDRLSFHAPKHLDSTVDLATMIGVTSFQSPIQIWCSGRARLSAGLSPFCIRSGGWPWRG